LAISHDGRWLVTKSPKIIDPSRHLNTVRLWDLSATEAATSMRVLLRSENAAIPIANSPDGRWLVTGGKEETARLWNLTVSDPATSSRNLSGHDGDVGPLVFSADSRWLVSGTTIWDLAASDPTDPCIQLRGQDSGRSIAISPDRRWLATGSSEAWLWDLTAPDPTASSRVLHGHKDSVREVAISQNGRWLVTRDSEKVKLWELDTDQLIGRARRLAGRELTPEEKRRHLFEQFPD
jgi:WD40 repeat protein